jgi:hypothetical protein
MGGLVPAVNRTTIVAATPVSTVAVAKVKGKA